MYSLQGIVRKNINNATVQLDRLSYIGNNMANYSTTGYKAVRFEQLLREDGYLAGALRTDVSQGSVRITSNPYDIALKGPGYIPVVSPDGEVQYTRDGAMKVGKGGYLMTSDDWLIGSGIQVPPNVYKMEIKSNGDVMVMDNAGDKMRKIGNIPIVQFDSPENLELGNNNKLKPTAESGEPKLLKEHDYVAQNALEYSNTNLFEQANDMMRLNTSMIASMKLIKVADDMYNKSINIRE